MPEMTMRERILAVVQGHELDRVPFVMYEGILPVDEVRAYMGPDRVGYMRWCRVHRIEHPNCHMQADEYVVGDQRWLRNTLHTPGGSLYEERVYGAYGTTSLHKHFVQEPDDYPAFWAFLEDCVVTESHDQYHQDQADLGDEGTPLVALERTPYQQLWVQWVGIDNLGYHLADCPDRVQKTIDMLRAQARQTYEIAYRSPAPFVDFPDNITAPTIGPKRFREYCLPEYEALDEMLSERGAPVFVHMDGDLKPLWEAISESKVGGLDSMAPTPDNDTSVADAVRLWPDMILFVNFPSSVHLRGADSVREEAAKILDAAGHTGHLQMQISENVPYDVWRTSFPAICEAIDAFGRP